MMWQTVRQNYKLPLFLGIGVSVVAVLTLSTCELRQSVVGFSRNRRA